MSEGVEIKIYFDGATEPNPGVGSYGFVIDNVPGHAAVTGQGIVQNGQKTTNNVSEWCALGFALKWLTENTRDLPTADPPVRIAIHGDSKLVVNQLTGAYACNAANLIPLRDRCRDLLTTLGVVWSAYWIPRADNSRADALSVEAWVKHTGGPFPERRR